MTSLLAPIVQVCDAISGARPGARREIVEAYIKRLNDLEQLAMSYPGVTKTYAIQAGRELRVIVGADKIDDKQTESLSGEIAKKIQDEMTYPGQVRYSHPRNTCGKFRQIKIRNKKLNYNPSFSLEERGIFHFVFPHFIHSLDKLKKKNKFLIAKQ